MVVSSARPFASLDVFINKLPKIDFPPSIASTGRTTHYVVYLRMKNQSEKRSVDLELKKVFRGDKVQLQRARGARLKA